MMTHASPVSHFGLTNTPILLRSLVNRIRGPIAKGSQGEARNRVKPSMTIWPASVALMAELCPLARSATPKRMPALMEDRAGRILHVSPRLHDRRVKIEIMRHDGGA
jgi:hypothetical protein